MLNMKEYQKEYYVKNKETLQKKRQQKQYCKCCDIFINKYNFKKHLNSWSHSYFNM